MAHKAGNAPFETHRIIGFYPAGRTQPDMQHKPSLDDDTDMALHAVLLHQHTIERLNLNFMDLLPAIRVTGDQGRDKGRVLFRDIIVCEGGKLNPCLFTIDQPQQAPAIQAVPVAPLVLERQADIVIQAYRVENRPGNAAGSKLSVGSISAVIELSVRSKESSCATLRIEMISNHGVSTSTSSRLLGLPAV